MSKVNLTNGALQTIIAGGACEKPVIQVLGVKKIQGQTSGGPDRYRLLLSDGRHSVSSVMLATQLNTMVEEGNVEMNCVICMQHYICNTIQTDKKVIVLLELQVVASGSEVGGKIGEPQALKQPLTNTHPAEEKQGPTAAKHTPVAEVTSTEEHPLGRIFPIASLTPYQGKWTIKGRVTVKTKVRTWNNSKGQGKLFSFNMADKSGEIKVTAFKDDVDRFYDMIEYDKSYFLKRAQLKAANKQFSNLPNDYEMTLSPDSEIVPVSDEDDEQLPAVVYNFVPIDQIQNIAPNSFIDVIGVVREAEEVRSVTQRSTSKELRKRDLHLVDRTNASIRLTLWGENAEKFDGSGHPVLVVRGCKVTDWNGRSLGESSNTQIIVNPPRPETNVLRGWFDGVGSSVTFSEYKGSLAGETKWLTLDELSAQDMDDRVEYFQCKATIASLKNENCLYKACPQNDCNKKLVNLGNDMYRCEKCCQEFPNFKWRLILQLNVCDPWGGVWQTCFQEAAEQVLQENAQTVGELHMQNDTTAYEDLFNNATFSSFIFKCRSKMEKFNDENRLKTVCLQATPVDHVNLSAKLIDELAGLLGPV